MLIGLENLENCVFHTQYSGLDIMFAGKYPPNPVELLGSKYFSTLLQEAKKAYDYIFIDTPPLGPVIDAAVIAPQCDGTIIVLGSSKIRIRQAQNVLEQLKKSECRVLGVVRNQSDAHGKGYYRNAPYYKGYYK